eukprot:scaffold20310_cov125-Isochrysis_galbana.AAC.9
MDGAASTAAKRSAPRTDRAWRGPPVRRRSAGRPPIARSAWRSASTQSAELKVCIASREGEEKQAARAAYSDACLPSHRKTHAPVPSLHMTGPVRGRAKQ